jgi:hypothetical protein
MGTTDLRKLRGGKIAGLYRPAKLPRALPSFADALEPEGETKPPAQRALTMVQHHKRWLEARRARIKQDVAEPNGARGVGLTLRHFFALSIKC